MTTYSFSDENEREITSITAYINNMTVEQVIEAIDSSDGNLDWDDFIEDHHYETCYFNETVERTQPLPLQDLERHPDDYYDFYSWEDKRYIR